MADQQLCQSSERILKLFLDESVTNKAISLQLWFNRFGKLQFRLSTAPSRRDNRRTTSNRDEGPAPVANRLPQKAPAQPQPTVTTRSTTAANKKRKTAPTISPVVESVRSAHEPSPEIPRCASQQSQHALSFLDPNERDKQSSDEEGSDEETIPGLQESESIYTSPFFNKNRFQALSSPQISENKVSGGHHLILSSVPDGHVLTIVCNPLTIVPGLIRNESGNTWARRENGRQSIIGQIYMPLNHLSACVTMTIVATVQANTMMTPSHKSPSDPDDFTRMIYVAYSFMLPY